MSKYNPTPEELTEFISSRHGFLISTGCVGAEVDWEFRSGSFNLELYAEPPLWRADRGRETRSGEGLELAAEAFAWAMTEVDS